MYLLAAAMWLGDGLVRELDSLAAVKAILGLVMIAGYRIEPILR
jgi:hypothetical protein